MLSKLRTRKITSAEGGGTGIISLNDADDETNSEKQKNTMIRKLLQNQVALKDPSKEKTLI